MCSCFSKTYVTSCYLYHRWNPGNVKKKTRNQELQRKCVISTYLRSLWLQRLLCGLELFAACRMLNGSKSPLHLKPRHTCSIITFMLQTAIDSEVDAAFHTAAVSSQPTVTYVDSRPPYIPHPGNMTHHLLCCRPPLPCKLKLRPKVCKEMLVKICFTKPVLPTHFRIYIQ